jgi:hypothetical protein
MDLWRRHKTVILVSAALLLAAGILVMADLTVVVTSKFNGRRWNLPSRI